MSKERLLFCGKTDMGRQRTNNEDAFVAELLDDHTVLAVAIDGVGGYEGGEVAAEIAQREIPAYLKEFNRGERMELLKQAVVGANNAIYERRQTDTARANMSCVLTSALIDTERKVVDMVHVGDTRLYQFHHGKLIKLSHDHSLIGYREEMGDLTEEQAMHHPQRNVISRDVGSARHEVGDPDFLEAEEFPLSPNSTFLLCSDGLTDLITSKQIVAILDQTVSLEEKAQMLIDAANEAGGKDNVTVVLVGYSAEEPTVEMIKDNPISLEQREIQGEHSRDDRNDRGSNKKTEKKRLSRTVIGCVLIAVLLVALIYTCKHHRTDNNDSESEFEEILNELYDSDATQENVDYVPGTECLDLTCTPESRARDAVEFRHCAYYEKEFFCDSFSFDMEKRTRNAGQAFRIVAETDQKGKVSLIFTKYLWEALDGDSILREDYGLYTIQHTIDDSYSVSWIKSNLMAQNGQGIVDSLYKKYSPYGYSAYYHIIDWMTRQVILKNIKVYTQKWVEPSYMYINGDRF